MRSLAILFAVGALVTGLLAAYHWYRATQVDVEPTWKVEPGDNVVPTIGWVAGAQKAFYEVLRCSMP